MAGVSGGAVGYARRVGALRGRYRASEGVASLVWRVAHRFDAHPSAPGSVREHMEGPGLDGAGLRAVDA
jgi:hypothetical protein